ncbi:MAG: ATP-binding domain-containing protein [Faecalibacterium sp.]
MPPSAPRAGSGGISALVRAIDAAALAGSTGQDIVPGGSRPGCVTVMTIHRSKGLQFPVVFVADTARRFNAADTRQPVLLHRMYGAGLRLRARGGRGCIQDSGLHGAVQCPRSRDAQ